MKVTILRGLPGSGKSRWADYLPFDKMVCCADDHHMKEGKYCFDQVNAKTAHDLCLLKYLNHLSGRLHLPQHLIVANTNCSAWEIAPYYRLAEVFGVEARILTLWCSVEKAHARNVHSVPLATIVGMYARLMEPLPSHWKHTIVMGE